eukprot:UN07151
MVFPVGKCVFFPGDLAVSIYHRSTHIPGGKMRFPPGICTYLFKPQKNPILHSTLTELL